MENSAMIQAVPLGAAGAAMRSNVCPTPQGKSIRGPVGGVDDWLRLVDELGGQTLKLGGAHE